MTSWTRNICRHFFLAILSGLVALLISVGSNHLYDAMKAWLQAKEIVCSPAAAACLSKVADLNNEVARSLSHGAWMSVLGVLIAALLAIPVARRTFSGSAARIWRVGRENAPAYRALILMPSLVDERSDHLTGKAMAHLAAATDRRKALAELCHPSNELGRSRWAWQQTLRLADHNYPRLTTVVCLCSREFESRYDTFKKLLEQAGPPGLKVVRIDGEVSINDYNNVEHALQSAIDLCESNHKIKAKDICMTLPVDHAPTARPPQSQRSTTLPFSPTCRRGRSAGAMSTIPRKARSLFTMRLLSRAWPCK